MESTTTPTQVVYIQKERNNVQKSEYDLDFWKEVKRRWMVPGVLIAVALAVLAPNFGAPGGNYMHVNVDLPRKHCTLIIYRLKLFAKEYPKIALLSQDYKIFTVSTLHMEYMSHIPRSYIYYTAGRTRMHACRTRMYVITILHAHVGAFILSVVSVNALAAALDRRVIEGAILASLARPCAWLPLSLNKDGITASLAAATYAFSFLFSPVAHFLLCGRIHLPPLKSIIINATTAVVPFALGTLSQTNEIGMTINKISALVILYGECCSLLREAEGSLYVIDVMATLFLVISWLTAVAAASYIYVKCRLLTMSEAQVVLLIATPKSTHNECARGGLARLPAVLAAPAQALLLALAPAAHSAPVPARTGPVHSLLCP